MRRFVWLISLLAFPALHAAQETPGLDPHEMARLRAVTSAHLSPDGTRVAYTLSVPRDLNSEDDGAAWTELHMVDVASGDSWPFVSGKVNVSAVAWRPDGGAVTFLAKRDDDDFRSLYSIPVAGGEARRVVQLGSAIASYSWSPDSSQVAVIASEPVSKERKALRAKGFDQEIYEEQVPHRRLHIVDAVSGESRILDRLEGSVFDVLWSPLADRLAITLAPRPLVDDSYMYKRVRIVSASGEVRASLDNPGKIGQMAWRPDGARLSVISAEDIHDSAAGRLTVMPAEGSGWRDDVLGGHEGHISQVTWRDNDTMAVLNDEGVWTHLEDVSTAGERTQRVDGRNRAVFTTLSVSADGATTALVGSSPRHPPEVFAMGPDDPAPRRLTNSNPWLDSVQLAPQEVVSFKARDGLQLEGLLVRPLDEQSGQRYPLILTVHGGPEAHHRNGWVTTYSNPGQMAAARGFAVFYTNYRGSTGRGVQFSKRSLGDPAGKEFDDLVDAVDALIEMGLVDRDRVGITGASYGGYATAWSSTRHSDRFAAGVMFVGISNNISMIGTSDIPDELFYVHLDKRPWDDWQLFLERSPIYHADKNRTPLLILHGDADPRVNPGQSREMYRYLKLRGQAPVRLVFYPGEGHGNARAASRLDYNLRLLRWFEHFLKSPGGDPPPWEIEDYGLEP